MRTREMVVASVVLRALGVDVDGQDDAGASAP